MNWLRTNYAWFTPLIAMSLVIGACQRPSDYLYTPNKPPDGKENKTKQVDQGLRSVDSGVSGHVDFIWVVGGMVERKQDFFKGGSDFMTDFSTKKALSWRMAVLGSDPYAAPELGMNPLFTDASPNPIAIFSRAISNVLQTIDSENIFDPVIRFLTLNPGFIRPEASLAIIISNDDNNRSSATASQFLDFLKTTKGDLSQVSINGVFGSTDLNCSRSDMDSDWNYGGSDYEKVIQATGGQAYSLCGPSFGSSLAQIGGNIVRHIATGLKILLPERPVPSTIVVSYHGQVLPSGLASAGGKWYYEFNDNAVGFYDRAFMNGATDTVHISYEPIQ